jgi:hypothetical protein
VKKNFVKEKMEKKKAYAKKGAMKAKRKRNKKDGNRVRGSCFYAVVFWPLCSRAAPAILLCFLSIWFYSGQEQK